MNTRTATASSPPVPAAAFLRLLAYSSIGLVMFFLPLEIAGKTTILFDHAATYLAQQQRSLSIALVLTLMAWGAAAPFARGSWRASTTTAVFSVLKVMGLVLALMYLLKLGPAPLFEKDMLPFLFDKLALTVGLIVPLGAVALAFLVGFGLLELVGVLMQPVMRPIWRTPGHSAIDAVASFVGSYSVGLLITNPATRQRAFYAPGLAEVTPALIELMSGCTVVLIDGTFWAHDEMQRLGLSAKAALDMGHLPQSGPGGMIEQLDQLPAGIRKILIHINNTNPMLVEDSDERAELTAHGIEVAHDGMSIEL